ncbi:hypothetical protein Tco_0451352 [Tanacetum coccineum]
MTWGWRKNLQLRPLIRKFIWYKVGDGSRVSLWYDQWCRLSPLVHCTTGYSNYFFKGWEIFHEGVLVWPQDLIARYPIINLVDGPLSLGSHDQLEWRDSMGKVKPFSVNVVWLAIRPRDAKVVLVDVIWWHVKDLAGLSNLAPSLDLIINAITHIAKRRTTRSVIAKLVVTVAAYFIWQERNSRLFKKSKRSEDQLVECITSSVRLKLISCCFKKSRDGLDLMRRWTILDSVGTGCQGYTFGDIKFVMHSL